MNNMFRCGCTSDVQGFPTDTNESGLSDDEASLIERDEDEHDPKDDGNSSSLSSAGDEGKLQMESAKHYMERISNQLTASNDAIKKQNASHQEQESIATVFRMSPSSTSTSTVNNTNTSATNHYPSLKHTHSESTQSTAAISEDELSYS